jgi:hypothetical protein
MLFGCLCELRIEIFTHRFFERKEKSNWVPKQKRKKQIGSLVQLAGRPDAGERSSAARPPVAAARGGEWPGASARKPSYRTPELL